MSRAPALEDSEAKPAGEEPPAAGSGGGPDARWPAEPLDLPEFPWPPLAASETMDLTTLLQVRGQFGRLGDANVILQNALRRTGYDTVSYLAVPHGFALVTRIEQIDNTGEPKPGASRWSLEVQPLGFRKFSLSAYLHALFYADPGRYRVLAFVVTDSPVTQSEDRLTIDEALVWSHAGAAALPHDIQMQAWTPRTTCVSLIYELVRENGHPPRVLLPGSLGALRHLNHMLWATIFPG